jgi:hypothetical protein
MEALIVAQEAIEIYERLVRDLADAFGADLLGAQNTLADVLETLGGQDEADNLRRQLGSRNPSAGP